MGSFMLVTGRRRGPPYLYLGVLLDLFLLLNIYSRSSLALSRKKGRIRQLKTKKQKDTHGIPGTKDLGLGLLGGLGFLPPNTHRSLSYSVLLMATLRLGERPSKTGILVAPQDPEAETNK
jgi:hypothetical protein